MVSSTGSTSMASAKVASSTSSKSSSEKRSKHRGEKERDRSDRKAHKDQRRKKSRRDSTSTIQEEHAQAKDDWKGKKVAGPKESAFRYLYPVVDIPIPPALIHDGQRAANELMDTLLMRYVPQLSGVLLSHRNISFLRSHASIDADGAYSTAPAGLTCLVWAPEVGMRLEGQIKLSTPSHVSLLVHGIFNASITSAHLPSTVDGFSSSKDNVYKWHELDGLEEDVKMEESSTNSNEGWGDDAGEKSTGYWVNKETDERLGGHDGKVVFTVVGMTVANHMLSVYGSMLRKPFSIPAPTYVPLLTTPLTTSLENARRVRFREEHQARIFDPNAEEDEGDSDDDELPDVNSIQSPEVVKEDSKKKKRSKVGPRREGETSGSESEGEAKREKKKRKKE